MRGEDRMRLLCVMRGKTRRLGRRILALPTNTHISLDGCLCGLDDC